MKKSFKRNERGALTTQVGLGITALIAIPAIAVTAYSGFAQQNVIQPLNSGIDGVCVTATLIDNPDISNKRGYCNFGEDIPPDTDPEIKPTPPGEDGSEEPEIPPVVDPEPEVPPIVEPEPEVPPVVDPDPGYVWDTDAMMTTVWDTSISPTCQQISLPIFREDSALKVDWGVGAGYVPFASTSPDSPVYGDRGKVTINLSGKFDRWGHSAWGDMQCLTEVSKWGDTDTTELRAAFRNAKNLTKVAAIPKTTKTLEQAFSNINNPDISGVRTPNVTDMNEMFRGAKTFNQPINHLDTSNVTDMTMMFYGAESFNQPLDKWKTSNVLTMNEMFANALVFNKSLNFETSKVTTMKGMFYYAKAFNQPIGGWDVSNVTNMESMFNNAESFNQSINGWNVSNVINMGSMFSFAKTFNQPIGNWITSSVTNMGTMFYYASDFNQDLSKWNVSKVVKPGNGFSQGADKWTSPKPNWNS